MPQTALGARQRAASQQRCMLGDRNDCDAEDGVTKRGGKAQQPHRRTGIFEFFTPAYSTRHARSPTTSTHMTTELPTADQELHMRTATERCSGTRGAPARKRCFGTRERCSGTRDVLRHAREALWHARRAPARERGAPARGRGALAREMCSGTRERCSGTRDVLRHAREVLRHAREVLRHARRAPARERGAPARERGAPARERGAPAHEVLRHTRCSGTQGTPARKVLRHARCFDTGEMQGHATTT